MELSDDSTDSFCRSFRCSHRGIFCVNVGAHELSSLFLNVFLDSVYDHLLSLVWEANWWWFEG